MANTPVASPATRGPGSVGNTSRDSGGANQQVSQDLHRYDDVDSGPLAHHHTVGPNQGQAASGALLDQQITDFSTHTHDGTNTPSVVLPPELLVPPEMTHFRTGTFSLPTNAWTKLTWSGISFQSTTSSPSLGSNTSGIVAQPGRYELEGGCGFALNATGPRRGIWLGPISASAPTATGQLLVPPTAASSGNSLSMSVSTTISTVDTFTVWAYQDSGAAMTLDATTFRLNVRRISQ